MDPPRQAKAGLTAVSALTQELGHRWAPPRWQTATGQGHLTSDPSLPQGSRRDSALNSPQKGLVLPRALAHPSQDSSKAAGLKFKGESKAGNTLIPGDGPVEECYRIFPWLFLLKRVHKQGWVMQLCISAF